MKYLVLSPGIKPQAMVIPYKKFIFPSGSEPHIVINGDPGDHVHIITRLSDMNDFMFLLLATDALRRMDVKIIEVSILFLPFARQDRVMNSGEPFSLKVIANIINAQNYNKVLLYDIHSDVATALINNSKNVENHNFVWTMLEKQMDYLLVCPDAGAYKKIYKLAQRLLYPRDIVMCSKVRELSTGKILRTDVGSVDVKDKVCYIVDDICDGGATFIGIAAALKEKKAKEVNLIVTHGIFSKGVDHLIKNGIDKVYTTDSIYRTELHEKLTEYKLI